MKVYIVQDHEWDTIMTKEAYHLAIEDSRYGIERPESAKQVHLDRSSIDALTVVNSDGDLVVVDRTGQIIETIDTLD